MTTPDIEKRFLFHANAVALAAHMRRREDFFVPAVASSCLPVTGGLGTAVARGEDFHGMIGYDEASTRVFGDFQDAAAAVGFSHGNHGRNMLPTASFAEGRITGLRITNGGRVLAVRELEARLESVSDRVKPPEFRSLTTNFVGITVDGVGLAMVNRSQLFNEHPTLWSLGCSFDNGEFLKANSALLTAPLPAIREGIFCGTFATGLHWLGKEPANTHIVGNKVTIDGFGSIYLGEIMIMEGFRRVTMLRFQLGSPDGGDGSAIDVQSNGTGWPPQGQ